MHRAQGTIGAGSVGGTGKDACFGLAALLSSLFRSLSVPQAVKMREHCELTHTTSFLLFRTKRDEPSIRSVLRQLASLKKQAVIGRTERRLWNAHDQPLRHISCSLRPRQPSFGVLTPYTHTRLKHRERLFVDRWLYKRPSAFLRVQHYSCRNGLCTPPPSRAQSTQIKALNK